MKQLFVMDPLDRINVEGDSTYMLMLEACKRGHRVAYCTPDQMFVYNGMAHAKLSFCTVTEDSPYFIVEDAHD